jgi:hypothetical protein
LVFCGLVCEVLSMESFGTATETNSGMSFGHQSLQTDLTFDLLAH